MDTTSIIPVTLPVQLYLAILSYFLNGFHFHTSFHAQTHTYTLLKTDFKAITVQARLIVSVTDKKKINSSISFATRPNIFSTLFAKVFLNIAFIVSVCIGNNFTRIKMTLCKMAFSYFFHIIVSLINSSV